MKKPLRCRALAKKLLKIADEQGDLEVFSYNYNHFFVDIGMDTLTTDEVHDTFRNYKYERRNLGEASDPKNKKQKRVAVLYC